MTGSAAGVAESIRVYHKNPTEHAHALDVEWTDPAGVTHCRRTVCTTDNLTAVGRPLDLCREVVPGVGIVCVSAPILRDPSASPRFDACLIRLTGRAIDLPVEHRRSVKSGSPEP